MAEEIVCCKNVGFKRDDFELKNINLDIHEGYITVITGKNGAGKSTLLSILSGQKAKYTGSVKVCGHEMKDCCKLDSKCEIFEKIGQINEDKSFFMECDPIENEMFLSAHFENWNKELYRFKLKEWGVSEATPLKNLSRGKYIRFQLAWSMAHGATVYFFDEPTAGLDPIFKKKFYRQVQELVEHGATVVLATNLYDDVARIADYHVVLENGSVVKNCEVDLL